MRNVKNDLQVSIVTPMHNSSEFIDETIRSVLSQTFQSWELIIVDDCSSDDSIDIANKYAKQDSRIKLVRLYKNGGAAHARNVAIKLAKGRYISFLDSDDRWLPSKLYVQLGFMRDNDVEFSFSAYEKIDESGKFIGNMNVPSKIDYHQLLKCCVIGCLTVTYDTKRLGKIYMPAIRKRQDFGLWLKILKKVDFAWGIKEPLAQYRVRKNSISSNKLSASSYTWRLYRDVEKLSFIKSAFYFSHYAIRGLLRTSFPRFAKLIGLG